MGNVLIARFSFNDFGHRLPVNFVSWYFRSYSASNTITECTIGGIVIRLGTKQHRTLFNCDRRVIILKACFPFGVFELRGCREIYLDKFTPEVRILN